MEKEKLENKEIKIDRYLVRGKKRDFQVLAFPQTSHLVAYDEYWDDRDYEIDGDLEGYQIIKYTLAILAEDPERIIYLPLRDKTKLTPNPDCLENYDAVFIRPELQFNRAEWIALRRQLNPAHKIEDYGFLYEPKKLMDIWEKFLGTDAEYRMKARRGKQDVRKLVGDTVFFTLLKYNCLSILEDILESEENGSVSEFAGYGRSYCPVYSRYSAPLGWIFSDEDWKMSMEKSDI